MNKVNELKESTLHKLVNYFKILFNGKKTSGKYKNSHNTQRGHKLE